MDSQVRLGDFYREGERVFEVIDADPSAGRKWLVAVPIDDPLCRVYPSARWVLENRIDLSTPAHLNAGDAVYYISQRGRITGGVFTGRNCRGGLTVRTRSGDVWTCRPENVFHANDCLGILKEIKAREKRRSKSHEV